MTNPQDKPASVEERFDATCAAHGLTPQDVRRIGLSPGGQAVLHDIAKEAGITTADHEAWAESRVREIHPRPLALAGGMAGGAIGAAAVPFIQLAKESHISWKAFARNAPKTTAIGAVLGGLAGAAAAWMTSGVNARRMRDAGTQWDEQENAWAKREAEKNNALVSPLSPGK